MSLIWIWGCGSVTWISPDCSAWKIDGVDGMYRKTTLSSLAGGPALNAVFFTSVSWVPFCQLWNLYGPLAMFTELSQMWLKSLPWTMCCGITVFPASASQAAYGLPFFHVMTNVLPEALIDWMSCQPVRSVMS